MREGPWHIECPARVITGMPASRDAENVTVARIDVQSVQLSASSSGGVFLDVDCGHLQAGVILSLVTLGYRF